MIDVFQAHVALGEFVHDDFHERGHFHGVRSGELDFVFLEEDFGFAVFEIKAGGEFFFRLAYGVFQFHRTDLRNDVE